MDVMNYNRPYEPPVRGESRHGCTTTENAPDLLTTENARDLLKTENAPDREP